MTVTLPYDVIRMCHNTPVPLNVHNMFRVYRIVRILHYSDKRRLRTNMILVLLRRFVHSLSSAGGVILFCYISFSRCFDTR